MIPEKSISFNIDRGGTFTDVFAEMPYEPYYMVEKLLSVDPDNYSDAPREGIRRIIEKVSKSKLNKERNPIVETKLIKSIRMGTTVGTNALLERKGENVLLITSKGFKDLLEIGNQSRPRIFDLHIKKPDLVYHAVEEINERVQLLSPLIINEDDNRNINYNGPDIKIGKTGEKIKILQAPNENEVREILERYFEKGIRSVAIVLVHSYTFIDHEEIIGRLAKEIGYTHVSLSHEVMSMIKVVNRGLTTCVDAYLTPLIKQYIDNFLSGFDSRAIDVSFMMSDGGLCPVEDFRGFRSILSGPAGGVVGYSMTTYDSSKKSPIIGFDMGGTSTDVSRFSGSYDHVFEAEMSGLTIQAPQLDIQSVAAGGGSRLFFKSGLFVVGPESVGAHPGPVCYKKNGNLAITDANLQLGRLIPEYFPSIFGPNQNEPLDHLKTLEKFKELTKEINEFQRENKLEDMSIDEIAYGYIRVANEAMCRPIRNITEAKGFDCSQHVLACFGGAGGQHACAIARNLGMPKVFIHKFSGILSAYGLGLADLVVDKQEPCSLIYQEENRTTWVQKLKDLSLEATKELTSKGYKEEILTVETYLNLRYSGTDTNMMIKTPDHKDIQDYESIFKENYQREYGFLIYGRDLLIDDIRVRVLAKGSNLKPIQVPSRTIDNLLKPIVVKECYFSNGVYGSRQKTPVYKLNEMFLNDEIQGPAIIIDSITTIVIEPDCKAVLIENGSIEIIIGTGKPKQIDTTLDPITLSVFSHRFMSIAEQMGKTLQRTSISTNIKERLDFSCALFGPDGGLVSNAPHLPVHLGSMQEAVKFQINHLGKNWKEGEVLLSNHPQAGGSHLPDLTVITPVYHNGEVVFYVASRGHHADIGGITPGSMPPFSKVIDEEGAAIISCKIVESGKFQEERIREIFEKSRNLSDNISDLKAQIAANKKGISLMEELIKYYSLSVVHAYMYHIQNNAELAVRDMLVELSLANNLKPIDTLISKDYMDDGSPIKLTLTINREERSACFDFTGTGPQVYGNTNAPPSVTMSAIIYCLRCLVKREIPLNQGCLNPITVKIPRGSLLNPSADAAVVGGNVLTSQRVTDVILSAFKAASNSQGCMNNLTFGNERLGYYETIAGGSGAGPTWNGFPAVQCHMTNTRITDVEVMEKRYPVLVREFSIRRGSGGDGYHVGGDGVIREIEFLENFQVSILSERRNYHPNGLEGGGNAKCGKNLLIRKDNSKINITSKNTIDIKIGERIKIKTPGGGGFGLKSTTK